MGRSAFLFLFPREQVKGKDLFCMFLITNNEERNNVCAAKASEHPYCYLKEHVWATLFPGFGILHTDYPAKVNTHLHIRIVIICSCTFYSTLRNIFYKILCPAVLRNGSVFKLEMKLYICDLFLRIRALVGINGLGSQWHRQGSRIRLYWEAN